MNPRIRVVCEDGLRFNITNAKTGEAIPGVRAITITSPGPHTPATVELKCLFAAVDVVADLAALEIVTVRGERRRFEFPPGTREVVDDATAAEDAVVYRVPVQP